jgi:hypothetical protein
MIEKVIVTPGGDKFDQFYDKFNETCDTLKSGTTKQMFVGGGVGDDPTFSFPEAPNQYEAGTRIQKLGPIVILSFSGKEIDNLAGETITVVPLEYRTTTAVNYAYLLGAYQAGGGIQQGEKNIGVSLNTQTGELTVYLTSLGGVDVCYGSIIYFLHD